MTTWLGKHTWNDLTADKGRNYYLYMQVGEHSVANQGQDARQQDAGEKQIIHRKEVSVWNKRLVQVKTGSEDKTSWN